MKAIDLSWFRSHAARFSGELRWDEPLSKHTYYQIGGPSALMATPAGASDLMWLSDGVRESGIAADHVFFLGKGTNILASDDGFPGLVIKTARLNTSIRFDGETSCVHAGVSVGASTLLRESARNGWSGLSFLTGIPGGMGGVVKMNAGTFSGETKDQLASVRGLDLATGEELRWSGEQLRFSYRENHFLRPSHLVLEIAWRVTPDDPVKVAAEIGTHLERRKATQPVTMPSCGSVFKNPVEAGMKSWQVIEKLGLRGLRVGQAQISEMHANFIVNLGGARASEVRQIIETVKSRARAELGLEMREEVVHLGS